MTTRLMLNRTSADEPNGGIERRMLSNTEVGTQYVEPVTDFVDHERLGEMSLESLLYYVLFGEGRLADETG
jgi:hypothetical protein